MHHFRNIFFYIWFLYVMFRDKLHSLVCLSQWLLKTVINFLLLQSSILSNPRLPVVKTLKVFKLELFENWNYSETFFKLPKKRFKRIEGCRSRKLITVFCKPINVVYLLMLGYSLEFLTNLKRNPIWVTSMSVCPSIRSL